LDEVGGRRAHAGEIDAFIEVEFDLDVKKVIPDGLIRVGRGSRARFEEIWDWCSAAHRAAHRRDPRLNRVWRPLPAVTSRESAIDYLVHLQDIAIPWSQGSARTALSRHDLRMIDAGEVLLADGASQAGG
jgi:hypothetical protein